MYISVRLGEVLNRGFLEFIIVLIGYGYEVVSFVCKLLHQVSAVCYTSTEHDSLAWSAKYFMGFLDPFLHDVTRDLHPALGYLVRTPFTGNLFNPVHVDLFGDIDP